VALGKKQTRSPGSRTKRREAIILQQVSLKEVKERGGNKKKCVKGEHSVIGTEYHSKEEAKIGIAFAKPNWEKRTGFVKKVANE